MANFNQDKSNLILVFPLFLPLELTITLPSPVSSTGFQFSSPPHSRQPAYIYVLYQSASFWKDWVPDIICSNCARRVSYTLMLTNCFGWGPKDKADTPCSGPRWAGDWLRAQQGQRVTSGFHMSVYLYWILWVQTYRKSEKGGRGCCKCTLFSISKCNIFFQIQTPLLLIFK